MADPIIILNTAVKMQGALGTAITITAITNASEAVFTNSGTNSLSAGDFVVITGVVGMTEMNNLPIRIKTGPTSTSFTAEGISSSAFATYVSGGSAFKVTSLLSFSNLTSFNFPEPEPTRLDATNIHGSVKRELFGLDDAAKITMDSHSDPFDAVTVELRAASKAKTTRVFEVTLQNGKKMLMNCYVAGGRGLDGSAGTIAVSKVSLTQAQPEQWLAT